MSNIRYEIDDSNVVRLWHLDNPLENNEPHLYQPIDPETGNPFESRQRAEEWVNAVIEKINTPGPLG